MHDLSLFLLELLENSARAGAGVVSTTIVADRSTDRLTFVVEDDGRGLSVTPDQALDPFYTTKSGKRTGLGLSLFRYEVEQADGSLVIAAGAGRRGTTVTADMGLSHLDRPPVGDVLTTIMVMAATNTAADFRLKVTVDGVTCSAVCADFVGQTAASRACQELLGALEDEAPAFNETTPSSGDTANQHKDVRSVG